MKKIALLLFAFMGLSLFSAAETGAASIQSYETIENEVKKVCNYDPAVQYGKDIPYQTANCLLTSVALKMDVPAEIVKGVATQEEGTWQQFKNGEPLKSIDNGYGIMQMTLIDDLGDKEKIKNNAIYNIYSGVKRLKDSLITPYVQKDDPLKYLEKWYFSMLRYNGNVPKNSPVNKCSEPIGARNTSAYQETVFSKIREFQFIDSNVEDLIMNVGDFSYVCDKEGERIKYTKGHFQTVTGVLTETKHLFNENDTLVTYVPSNSKDIANIRKTPTKDINIKPIQQGNGIVVKPTGNFVYDLNTKISNRFVWYPVKLQDSREGYASSSYLKRVTTRLEGKNRYETAVEISKEGWKQSETVVIATGEEFADALSGTPLAAKYDAPLLLVNSNPSAANTAVFNEIKRLKATKAILLGGSDVVSSNTEKTLNELGLSVSRIAGSDRYVTSAKIAEQISSNTAILAIGTNFADAVSIAPYAAKNGHPILLTRKTGIPAAIMPAVNKASKAYVIGGDDIISNEVFNSLKAKNPVRISGKDRYATSKAIINQLPLGNNEIFVATGMNFPDALSGAVLAAKNNSSIMLAKENNKGLDVIDNYQSVTILGGAQSSTIPNPQITYQMEEDMINLLK
ncbi:cell wall-binding repeat-containing protein [Metabacillus sp. JX24]|uniref:cell wall-binding repeat-containing protein n=1 Tax=Metabacillus sp. JX24 TaxID=3240759 RepID=UPI00350F94DB